MIGLLLREVFRLHIVLSFISTLRDLRDRSTESLRRVVEPGQQHLGGMVQMSVGYLMRT